MNEIFPDGVYFSDRSFLSPNLRIIIIKTSKQNIFDENFIQFYKSFRHRFETFQVSFL